MKLRPIEPEDIEFLYTIENDPELWDTTDSEAPYSRYALRRYVESMQSVYDSGELRLVIEIEHEGQPLSIGTIQLSAYSPLHARAEVGLALLRQHRGQGYASRAMRLLEQIAVSRLRIHTLYATVAVSNAASLALFDRLGYQRLATLPEWLYQGGAHRDALLLTKVFAKKACKGLVD